MFSDSSPNNVTQSSFPMHYGTGIERVGSTSDVTSPNYDQGGQTMSGQSTYPLPGHHSKQRTTISDSQRYVLPSQSTQRCLVVLYIARQ
jgi:hypothetical protein